MSDFCEIQKIAVLTPRHQIIPPPLAVCPRKPADAVLTHFFENLTQNI